MTRSIGKLAETLASGVSRRGFLGWAAGRALPLAAALGAALAAPRRAYAQGPYTCCYYQCENTDKVVKHCVRQGKDCPDRHPRLTNCDDLLAGIPGFDRCKDCKKSEPPPGPC
jgi:hypothetical protein